jgi:tetratricopeptide (TPR) repeat protein
MVRRRAVIRHLMLAARNASAGEAGRRIAFDHLDHAGRIGLESAQEFLLRADILADLDLWERADDDLARAAALAPGDDEILSREAFVCASRGRFRRAGLCYARMSSLHPASVSNIWVEHAAFLVLAGDHARYRQLGEELVRRSGSHQDGMWLIWAAYASALEPVSSADAETRVRIAQRGYDAAATGKDLLQQSLARFALGAALVRARAPARAEPIFREAIARESAGVSRALGDAWLAIALWHQDRRGEAKTWFDQADRVIRAQVPGGRPEFEHRPPQLPHPWDWWHLMIAWREAQGLLLDGSFPVDPFAR